MSQRELSFRAPGGDKPARPRVWTVTQLVRGANRMLEGHFSNLWVEGEVSSLKISGTGHAFFTLADATAALPGAMWKAAVEALPFTLDNGQKLLCLGRLGIFPKQGRFQFYIDRAEPAGLGARMLQLAQLKDKLAAEGLFQAGRKRPLPRWPRIIGVVTSPRGAAIHDIIEVARRRCPSQIVLAGAVVQGPEAPRSLVSALAAIAKVRGVDVVIVGRGGGSAEDLWCFNDEAVVRAVAACPVPIVSAVGHEVDTSLCDLAADLRAATPSHAAELVVPDHAAAGDGMAGLNGRLRRAVARAILDQRGRLDAVTARLVAAGRALATPSRTRLHRAQRALSRQHPRQRTHRDRRRLDATTARLHAAGAALPRPLVARLQALDHRLRIAMGQAPRRDRVALARLAGALQALSPLAVLGRGYAVVTTADGRALLDAAQVEVGASLGIRLHRGSLAVRVAARAQDPSVETDES